MEVFTPAPAHDVLLLVIRLGVLLGMARLLGELSQRLGQPSVLGELGAGVLLGPSVLGALAPPLREWLVPAPGTQGHMLGVVSLLGAMLLLAITGLETDVALIRNHARTALGTSAVSLLVAGLGAFALGMMLPAGLLPADQPRAVAALFLANAVSIAAISVVAKVLMDLDLLRRDIGQTLIAAGLLDDIFGWMLLSVVAGLAAGHEVSYRSVALALGEVVAFLLVSATVGRWLVRHLLDLVQERAVGRDMSLSLVVVLTFLWGAITQALHLEAVLGAFVMGILLGQTPRLPSSTRERLESVALGIFAPIFFASAGLRVDLRVLGQAGMLPVALALFAVAVGGKALGAYLGARLAGRQPHWPATAFGAGLNARGGTDIIIATVGLTLGLITGPLYSVVVVQAMLASLLSPTALRWALRRVAPSSEELARLEAERQSARSLVGSLARVLVPIRPPSPTVGDAAPTIAATRAMEIGLLSSLSRRRSFQTTLFSVAAPGARAAAERYLGEVSATFSPLKPAAKVVEHRHPPEAVIAESQRNYDLMLLGAHVEPDHPDAVFDPVVDDLIRLATCPTLVVRGKPAEQTMSWPPERILVRANGTRAARHAAEVAFALAGEASEVILLHVVVPRHDSYYLDVADRYVERHLRIGHEIVGALAEIGRGAGVSVDHEVRVGRSEDAVILEVAQTRHVDVLVLGTHLRPASERLYLGARVERLLRDAACAVIVVNAP